MQAVFIVAHSICIHCLTKTVSLLRIELTLFKLKLSMRISIGLFTLALLMEILSIAYYYKI
jgi:hypothetical protein